MLDYLVNHARLNVWCTPDQDLQAIMKPARITPINGVSGRVSVMWTKYALPTPADRYHVYQIGQRHPIVMGLSNERNTWIKLSEVCGAEELIVDLYVTSGIHLQRSETWMWVGPDKNVLIAVKILPKFPDLNNEDLYIRLYSNAYFHSDRRTADDKIVVKGQKIETTQQRVLFQQDYLDHVGYVGYAYAFVNGRFVHDVNPNTCEIGDYAEFVYDSTIYRVINMKVQDLEKFDSTLDLKRKYLLHYGEFLNDRIDYRDDIDFWLIKVNESNGRYSGVYFHKNQEDAVRMVTHKDYSIPVPYVNSYVNQQDDWTTSDELTVRMHVRKSGYNRPLINEHHRIKELYRLTDDDVKGAMLGINSNVDEWRAESLEESGYTRIMRDGDGLYDQQLVQDAYGYNAITKLLADTPQEVIEDEGNRFVDLPLALQKESTVYEYDAQGLLLGFHHHTIEQRYFVQDVNTEFVEVISGIGSDDQGTVFGEQLQQLDPTLNYRFYTCPIINNEPTEEWTDVTGTSAYEITSDDKVDWQVDFSDFLTAVRVDNKHLAYTVDIGSSNGMVKFTINAEEPRYGIDILRAATIPPARLDIWLNGHAMIENLDYYVVWPQVVICNKDFLSEDTQEMTIRASGFCDSNLEREEPSEFGFVEHGLLSRNSRYDVRDDKVLRITVEGSVMTRDQLLFSENDSGITMDDVRNGAPYLIEDVIVPLRGVAGYETYAFRERSREVDDKISDYLTLKLPEPEKPDPSIIPERYKVYSPFCSKVMHDLQDGIIDQSEIEGHYSDAKIWDLLDSYLYLLDYEPTMKGYDQNYVEVHPHNYDYVVELNIYRYNFLQRAVRVILDDRIDLSGHIQIGDLVND